MADTAIEALIDTERYPLDAPDGTRWAELVAAGRRELAATGSFNLDRFLRADPLARAVAEIEPAMASGAHHHKTRHNIYFSDEDDGDAATARSLQSSHWTLAGDQLRAGVLRRVYEWAGLQHFLAGLFDKPRLYPMADPLACLNAMSYGDGDGLAWHFDRSQFTVTLLLRAAGSGGIFEYRRNLRAAEAPNRAGVARLLGGEDAQVATLPLAPGTLNVFAGFRSAHRVTPVTRAPTRLIAVLSYMERPDVGFDDADRRRFYGRAEPLPAG